MNSLRTLIASVIRLPYLHHLNQSTDPTWDVVNIAMWSIAELGSAITLTSVPAIRPLVGHYFPHLMGSLVGKSTGDHANSDRTPVFGGSSRSKKTTEFSATETMPADNTKAKQDWHQYIELDDQDDARTKRSADMESQEHILPPSAQNPARAK
ncbi:9a8cf3c1-f0de-4662-bd0b-64339b212d48 [Thermothielavioides terrestris]|uniref:9a8cf3c1-f0de-4662-bd0b-64339b212d48 n=1 Tax=Thermothielavioides terrestris TaxID=2587410 RepID=A0A446BTB6_9PEZI|nr:9a8cf3c1-f0de-4662-bd0b-64339b212d48 [Thermothielavioides terrestris]